MGYMKILKTSSYFSRFQVGNTAKRRDCAAALMFENQTTSFWASACPQRAAAGFADPFVGQQPSCAGHPAQHRGSRGRHSANCA